LKTKNIKFIIRLSPMHNKDLSYEKIEAILWLYLLFFACCCWCNCEMISIYESPAHSWQIKARGKYDISLLKFDVNSSTEFSPWIYFTLSFKKFQLLIRRISWDWIVVKIYCNLSE
jgi:hypothetical protein